MKTYKDIKQAKTDAQQDLLVLNAKAKIGWKIVINQTHLVTIKAIQINNNSVVYLCKGKTRYYEILETEVLDYLDSYKETCLNEATPLSSGLLEYIDI